ncbi:MAG: MBL fold metallo-hydrolase [Chloroflexota bacterium]|nr:MAG: MBL fold metallo-hydrolase [Chloroflexota bacterium]
MPRLGSLEYQIVSDGWMWVDGGSTFGMVPRIIWAELFPPDAQNRVPFALNSLLIRSEGRTILVDTGYGLKLDEKARRRAGLERPEGDVVEALARQGVTVEEIDIVLNTHLHGDHCGGNTIRQGERLIPAFPRAQYWVQRLEWADAIAPNERTRATYLPENYRPLEETGQLRLINGATRLTGEVRTAITRGHTRAHQVVILESGGETALFVADMASLHYHLERLAWVPAYDLEPMESIETKRYWQQWAVERDALIIFQHDTEIPLGKLRPDGVNFRVEPVLLD